MAGAPFPRWLQRIATPAFAAAVIVVGVLLLLPGRTLPETHVSDKLEHMGAFAALAFLGALAFPRSRHRLPMAIALLAFGVICEFLQLMVPGRSASALDAVADAIGVFGMAGILMLAERLRFWQPRRETDL